MPPSPAPARPLPTRLMLGAAALIALAATGYALFERQRVATPADASAPLDAANKAGPQPDIDAQISQLETRLKAKPDDAEGWRMLGWSFFETGRFAESARAYARATQIAPGNAEYWSALGEALVLAGKGNVPPDARTAFNRALGVDPSDPRARYFLGVAKDIDGDHKGAIEDWLTLLADTPAGAPWEADVRRIISEVATKEKIDVAAKLAALRPASPAGGAAVATAAIPGPSTEQMRAAAQIPKGQQDAMIASMVDGLEAKLKANPANVDGWIMLLRSRTQLGQTSRAALALTAARTALARDPAATKRLNEAAAALGVGG